jgi:hypothetical protein
MLCIFIRAINENFGVTVKLIGLEPLNGTTKRKDIFEKLKLSIDNYNLDRKKTESSWTDGAPTMVSKSVGASALPEKYLNRSLFKYHFIYTSRIILWRIFKSHLCYRYSSKMYE